MELIPRVRWPRSSQVQQGLFAGGHGNVWRALVRRSGKKCGHTIRQALPRHIGMLGGVISGIVGIETCEHVRRGAMRGHRTLFIAQDLSIEFVREFVHGASLEIH